MTAPAIRLKRIFDPPSPDDGLRVLVDRIWPHGVIRERAEIDLWARGLAPTGGLRRWFGHDPARFSEFRRRYLAELDTRVEKLDNLITRSNGRTVTLLYSARDTEHNQAVVLAERLAAIGGREAG